jgi:hypothetical protein
MRPSLPALVLLVLSACSDPADPPFISGTSGTDTAANSTGSSGTTSGLPTTSIGETDPTGQSSSSSSSSTTTDPGTTTESSSSGEPGSSSSTSSSGEPGTDSSSSGDTGVDLCKDGAHNQDETDVDCGGALCGACAAGAACQVDVDCETAWCDAMLCAVPECLADVDCDGLDTDCVAASCDPITRACTLTTINDGQLCDGDGDLCTIGGTCDLGACVAEQPKLCNGLDNFCGVGTCDPGTGVCIAVPVPGTDGAPCDDGFVCTPDDTCVAGLCGAGGPGYLFFDDFSGADPGWELGPNWQIGPALLSKDGYNGADPTEDHSPGADERLAGVLIGGLIPVGLQDKTCLTSPVIPAPGKGPLWLTFWRHLHTDYFPFVVNTVEAFDGKSWQEVDVGYNNPGVGDVAWTFLEYDISAYSGPKLRVRICYSQTDAAILHAGWSLDDLTVGPYSCTPE